jgi:predicted phage tail protein
VSGFQCALRKKGKSAKFSACKSPKAYSGLAAGTYTFLVRAFNLAGPDPTPATKTFTIK